MSRHWRFFSHFLTRVRALVGNSHRPPHQLTFVLLADEQDELARKCGVPLRAGGKTVIKDAQGQAVRDASGCVVRVDRKFTAARWTFVIDKNGLIASIEKSVSPRYDSQQALDTAVQLVSR